MTQRSSGVKSYVFRVVVEPDEDRWVASCPALEEHGAATWDHRREEALKNIQDVVQMTVESMLVHGEAVPDGPARDVRVFPEPQVAVTLKRLGLR
jgi:predicted RNase H-like HicB family nuclease